MSDSLPEPDADRPPPAHPGHVISNDDALVGSLAPMTPDTNSGGIDMASDNGVISVPVTPVSRVAVAGPITIAVSRVAVAGSITRAIGRGVAVTGPIGGSRKEAVLRALGTARSSAKCTRA